ncbi:MAG TPA: single-stranded DNA-binding protein [Tepidisphaeraceae bacterium]|jgi:single-strand DNA-binding protein
MPAFNRVTLIGNLTRDPETKQLPGHRDSALDIAEFGLAVNRRFRTSGGEDREETLYIDCTAFGKAAETIGEYARKGRLLLVEGRLKYETWEDRTGGKRSKISVVVENFQFLGNRESESALGGGPAESGVRPAPAPRPFGAQKTLAEEYQVSQQRAAATSDPLPPADPAVATATMTAERPSALRARTAARKRGPNIPDVTEDAIPF